MPLPASGAGEGAGSIIVLIATDAPLLPGQCERVARRAGFGIARTGGMGERSSGDFALCFATGNRGLVADEPELALRMLNDGRIDALYEAVIDAVEESILNALLAAETMTGRSGNTVHGLPHELLRLVGETPAQLRRRASALVGRHSSQPWALGVAGDERGVAAARGEQLLVRADLGDAAAVEHDDLVGVADGREPVGDRDRRPALGQPLERLLDGALGLRVERGRRLVEDEDRRVAQDRPRDRDPLPLAAREAVAALADDGLVAVREAGDQLVDLRRARGLLDLLVGRVGPREAEVVAHARVEEVRLLADDADRVRERREGELAARRWPSIVTLPRVTS